jgi:hypothetical protein
MSYARAYQRSSVQTISNNTVTQIILDTPVNDSSGFFRADKLGFVIPAGRAGLYVVMVSGYWEGHPTGGTLRQLEIRSGNFAIGGETKPSVPGSAMWTSAFCFASFNVGDTITFHIIQNSGTNLKFHNASVLMYAPSA